MDHPVRVAVVGLGAMGSAHARVLGGMKDVELVAVVDADGTRAEEVAALHRCRSLTDSTLLDGVDAVSVAVPSSLHADVAGPLLRRGIHCLVEKPLATSPAGVETILGAARDGGARLLVGHIERFNPAVAQLYDVLSGEHRVLAVEAHRMSAVSGRITDVDVVLDLMVHDLDVVTSLIGTPVDDVVARGVSRDGGSGADHVTAMLTFRGGTVATLTASRITQNQIRRLEITTDRRFVTVDYSSQELLIFRQGRIGGLDDTPDSSRYVLDVGTERVFVRRSEPLAAELAHFVDVVRGNCAARVDGETAAATLDLAWEIQRQLTSSGAS